LTLLSFPPEREKGTGWGKILPRRRASRGFSLSLRERVWGEGKEQDF